jgi:rubredoxin-NAD+ reductase
MNKEQHVCVVCGYVHEENSSEPWDELPEDYLCPECGVGKQEFEAI